MSLDFKTKDFFHPVALLRNHYFLERSQWFPPERLAQYQHKKLRALLVHAYRNVPYYTDLFDRLKLSISDFNSIADLEKIPPLTKALIQQHGPALVARNAQRFSPHRFKTYGTTGKAVEFYLDKNILIMEFCRYWRQWRWAGYRLGQPIADFSTQHFLENQLLSSRLFHFQPIANRLVLNPSLLSQENVPAFIKALRDYRVSFIKATPSVLCIFAMFLKKARREDLVFKALFTTGEVVLPSQRKLLEETFHGPLFDSYGQMESTISFGQCAQGRYHLNAEYGIFSGPYSGEKNQIDSYARPVYGTSLHNFAMPFIRYEIGDVIVMASRGTVCACGRTLPVAEHIHGRDQDIVITPDRRFIGNLFVFFNHVPGIEWFQIIQDTLAHLTILVVATGAFTRSAQEQLLMQLRQVLGAMTIEFKFITIDELCEGPYLKYRPIITRLAIKDYL